MRRGCVRSSDGTTPSTLEAGPLAKARGHAPFGFLPNWLLFSFSQITSTGLVDVDDIELCEETQSRENTDEEEEEAEEEIEDA